MLKSLNTRFKHIFDQNVFTFSTVLDPRFKLNYIPIDLRQTLVDRIVAEMVAHTEDHPSSSPSAESEIPENAGASSGFWKCFEELGASQPRINNPSLCTIRNEFEQYLTEKIIERKQNPYAWRAWK